MASIYFFSSHPEQHLNTCLVVLTWLVCFWGGMLHHMTPRGKIMSYRCCNGDPRSLSESPHFTHPPPLLHGYETGTGFFVWFFFHSSFGNQTSAVRMFAGLPFQRGSAAGCRWRWQSHKGAIAAGRVAWLEGAPRTRGAQPGWPLGERAQLTVPSEREREFGKPG